MEFCPTCGTLLQYELPYMNRSARLFCPACPYACQIEPKVKIKRKQMLQKKEIDAVFSKEDMDNAANETTAPCPNCYYEKAAFFQMQTRGADEPMTIFYQCKNKGCGHHWREG